MLVDTLNVLWFKVLGLVLSLILLAMLLTGVFGPSTYQQSQMSAYKCANDSHTWNPNTCTGVEIGVRTFLLFPPLSSSPSLSSGSL